jgi:hypothetical protein
MHGRKRTALLLAAVGALTIGGAGSAGATDNGSGTKSVPGGQGSQKNQCDTTSTIGPIRIVGLAPAGDITTETNCVNYSESGVMEQSNRCRHTSTIGSITINPGLAPAGDITSRTNCINYSKTGGALRQSNKCETRSTIGDITISPLAPGPKVTQETNCANVSGTGNSNDNNGSRSGR